MQPRQSPPRLARALTAGALALTPAAAFGQVGTPYCTAAPNSTGVAASISGLGTNAVPANDLRLRVSGLPTNTAGYFLCSRNQGFVANPGGSAGDLCLGNPVGRLVGGVVVQSGATGTVAVQADLLALPQPGGAVTGLAGETWNFQCWYRDTIAGGGATSNFSDGLAVLLAGSPTPIAGMVPIPAGSFLMGSDLPVTEINGGPFGPIHQVTLSQPFWMGAREVTQAEYLALMGSNPSFFSGATNPVELVSWNAARAYCAALTVREAANLPAGYEYRLPTEAEWEYACRAGSTTEFHTGPSIDCGDARIWGYEDASNLWSCNSDRPLPVGSYAPNGFGLFDMHGNVAEWCLDSLAPYTAAAVTDPFVTGGVERVYRGGGWDDTSRRCRSAWRDDRAPTLPSGNIGFRVVLARVLVP